jgi:cytoskeletal protein RodZ
VVKARRAAKANTARIVVPIVIGLALLVAGGVAAWQLWPDGSTTSAQPQSSVTVTTPETSAPPTSAEPSATPTSTETRTASADPDTSQAQAALESCQAKVEAGDAVIDEAKTGVGHWAKHVDSQRQADLGNYTVEEMKAQFKATRLLGPGDQKRYRDAVDEYRSKDGSCEEVSEAPTEIAEALEKCAKRSSAQKPVMEAGKDAMADWASHLADMQRSKAGHFNNPQKVWLRAYRAAPENINAFDRASDRYNPPEC